MRVLFYIDIINNLLSIGIIYVHLLDNHLFQANLLDGIGNVVTQKLSRQVLSQVLRI